VPIRDEGLTGVRAVGHAVEHAFDSPRSGCQDAHTTTSGRCGRASQVRPLPGSATAGLKEDPEAGSIAVGGVEVAKQPVEPSCGERATSDWFGVGLGGAYIGRDERFMRHAIHNKLIPFYKVGRRILFRREDLDAYLASVRVESTDRVSA
jgi:excisionase family DNA binding protein